MMRAPRGKLFLLINLLSVIRVSLLETIHFTNSANKILEANNYTTYKVDVPNGEPITIIEASMPLIDKKIKFDDAESAQYPIKPNEYHLHNIDNEDDTRKYNKPVMELETSLSMTVTPNNYNDEYENAATGGEESVKNDYSNLSPEQQYYDGKRNTMKTVYSPELLQKFLKDYANKIHMATSSTLSTPPQGQNFDTESHQESEQIEKDKYVSSIEQTDVNEDDSNRRVSNHASNNSDKSEEELEDVQQRKNYRPNNHPYNKNNGWVTLDAVPWSKSKVSKWQSNNKNNFNNNRPYRPPNYDYDYSGSNNNNDNEDYYLQKPSRPTYQNNQFFNTRPSSHDSRPPQQFHSTSHHNPSSYHYEHDQQRPNRPSSADIITDNRPSNFPSHNEDYHHQPQQQQYNSNNYHQSTKPSHGSNNRPPSNYNDYTHHYNNHHGGNQYHSFKDGPHPATYPHNGDGEWILVSTTKGYQFPKRNGQRAILIKAQNGVGGSEMQYNDNNGIITAAAESQNIETIMRPHQNNHQYYHRPSPTKMTQQQAVKLTVLPLFVNEQKPSSGNKYGDNKVNVSVYKPASSSYHGIIESDHSNQTIEESVNEAHAANAGISTQKKKRKVIKKKNYALMRKNGGGSDSSAVIAAVGASLLPASLGLIAPMVLG